MSVEYSRGLGIRYRREMRYGCGVWVWDAVWV